MQDLAPAIEIALAGDGSIAAYFVLVYLQAQRGSFCGT
jgi:hypothetical protein